MPSVLLASCAQAAGRDDDEPLLVAALAELGISAAAADWADPAVDWAAAAVVVVRSTWDYAPRRSAFLAWARAVELGTPLLNPADLLAWNTDKRYLRELGEAGVPTVPTAWVHGAGDLDAALGAWAGDVVVKPVVSAGARDTGRFAPSERAAAGLLAGRILAGNEGVPGRAVMVQPYLERLDVDGETGLVYIDGRYSHAFRKGALLAAGPLGPGLFAEEEIDPRVAAPDQRALGDRVLAEVLRRTGRVPLYARVDLVPGTDGEPQVIELELTEPSLNLYTAPGSAARFAAAIAARLG